MKEWEKFYFTLIKLLIHKHAKNLVLDCICSMWTLRILFRNKAAALERTHLKQYSAKFLWNGKYLCHNTGFPLESRKSWGKVDLIWFQVFDCLKIVFGPCGKSSNDQVR